MSETNLSELASAEIVPNMGGENAWMIRVSEGDYRTVNKSGKNTLLIKGDVDVQDNVSYGGILVDFDLENDDVFLHNGDDEVCVPDAKHEAVLWSVYDEDGPRLERIFEALHVPTVRQGLMDQFMPRFRQDGDISKKEGGWLVDDDILVEWDGSNHTVAQVQTHIVKNSKTVAATEDKEARDISMPAGFSRTDSFEATAPDGRTFDIDTVELKFLTTVGLILDRNPSNYDDDLYQTIGNARIVAFTDTRSGLHHGHSQTKHQIQDLGVTDECADMLWSNENDHTAVREMALREQELKNAPIDVFENVPNDDTRKWSKIHSTKEKAPVPTHIRKQLEEQFE